MSIKLIRMMLCRIMVKLNKRLMGEVFSFINEFVPIDYGDILNIYKMTSE